MVESYGPVCTFRVGAESVCIVNDPGLVQEILTSRASEFHRTRTQKRLFGRIVGNGLILSDGIHWQKQRRLAQPAFHQRQIATYMEVMQQIAEQHVQRWPRNEVFDFDQAVTALTLNIVAVTLLGSQPPRDIEAISTALAESQRAAVRLMKLGVTIPGWLPTSSNRKLKRSVRAMNSVILPVIAEKRRTAGDGAGDLLSMFIAAVDADDGKRKMTDKEVRDEAVTMLLAGHDTTANLLAWTIYLLGKHKDVYARLQREVDEVFCGKEPSVEGLRRLTYGDMVLREVMRLYPPVYLILREPVHDLTLGGFEFKKGQMLMLSPWLLHRDPNNFEDPEAFNPDRLANDGMAAIPAEVYIPFGAGPHRCIGSNFAVMEALIILVRIAQELDIHISGNVPVQPEPLITLGVRNGLPIIVRKRDDDAN
jgi:cytochrome P450